MHAADDTSPSAVRRRLLDDLQATRGRYVLLRRRLRWAELVAAWVVGVGSAALFRSATGGGVGAMVLGAGNWLFTAVIGLVAFVATRGVISALGARRLLPARREVAAAETRLWAHDSAYGRR